ncbi:MAG: isocitrate/isopropylmalate dehydrogenase family protein [Sedimentisphaerales bacterium]|nr:isocitrate/isopropylmalate dehydrogenase family protein [Sedimentisphaerales bacterium]
MVRVTLIPGDGTGPELAQAARRCIDATGAAIEWEICQAGSEVAARLGDPLPEQTIESVTRNRVALKGPITTPVGSGYRSVNVFLRQHLDLYACVRPCKSYRGIPSRYQDIDLVVIRENTEDLYAGIEFQKDSSQAQELISWLNNHSKRKIRQDSGLSIKPISVYATERIVRFAFEYARSHGRRKVTSVHKANIMKHTDGLWLEVSREVARRYPDIQFEDRIVDNMCMQLVIRPQMYDVLVLPNLYGDIISDLCAGLIGGLGVAPGANIGDNAAIFEATHGSAPKYAGLNKVNPTAMILSGVLMLHHLGMHQQASRLEKAVADVIAEGRFVTYDLKPNRDDPSAVGTSDMADAIIARLGQAALPH